MKTKLALLAALLCAGLLAQTPTAPAITTQPANQVSVTGGTATFSVIATGTPPLSYQWRKGSVPIQGWTNATLTMEGVSTNDTISYDCIVTNAVGSAISTAATLTIDDAPTPPTKTAIVGPDIWLTLLQTDIFTIKCGVGIVSINCKTGAVTTPDPAVQSLPDTAIAFWKAVAEVFPQAKAAIKSAP